MSASTRPRIALVVPGLDLGGGVPAVAAFVARTIRRAGRFDLSMVSLPMSSRDPSSVLIRRPRTWLRGIATRNGRFDGDPFVEVGAFLGEIEFMRYRPRRQIADEIARCDLVQVVSGTPAWANAVLPARRPVALQVATLTAVERRKGLAQDHALLGAWRRGMTCVAARLDRIALKRVDAVFVENPWMAEHAAAMAGAEATVRYAPPGIDSQLFRPKSLGEASPLNRPYILCVGRLSDPRKNVGLLLDAFARLPAVTRPLLVLAGADVPEQAVAACVARLGDAGAIQAIRRPSQDELARLYRHATAFALPSDEEGFGMVVIEAMASGVPVVATRCGGPDGIIRDGHDGFLVDRDDPDAMAARLQELIADAALAGRIGAAARATVERTYSEEAAGRPYIETYDRLLARGPAAGG